MSYGNCVSMAGTWLSERRVLPEGLIASWASLEGEKPPDLPGSR